MSLILGGKGPNGELRIMSYDLVRFEHIGFVIPPNQSNHLNLDGLKTTRSYSSPTFI
jgi:hypothetical protein